MSEEVQEEGGGFETVAIAPGGRWFDLIERVLYENKADFPISIALGHTVRKVTHIVINKATEEEEQKLNLKALEGKEISE